MPAAAATERERRFRPDLDGTTKHSNVCALPTLHAPSGGVKGAREMDGVHEKRFV